MLRVLLLCALLLTTLGGIFPAQAQTAGQLVTPPAGHYSLTIPAGWTATGDIPVDSPLRPRFMQEALIVTDSQATLDAWTRRETTGSILLATMRPTPEFTNDGNLDLAINTALYAAERGTGSTAEYEIITVDGVAAGRVRNTTPSEYFPGYTGPVGATAFRVGIFEYRVVYAGEDIETLEAIAASLARHDPPLAIARPPAALEDETLYVALDTGWLLVDWTSALKPFATNYAMTNETATSWPSYYLLFPTAQRARQRAFTELIYLRDAAVPAALPDLAVQIVVYPYDNRIGAVDVAVDDALRREVFASIAADHDATFDPAALVAVEGFGAPGLQAPLESAFGTAENRGLLTVFDANARFYAILAAGPAASWDPAGQAVTDALRQISLRQIDVAPVGLQIGQQAPDFTLDLLDGSRVQLSDLRGQIVLLNFWATWCGPCRAELPHFAALDASRDDVTVLAIALGEAPATVETFAQEHGYRFPIGLDPLLDIGNLYEIVAYPTTFMLDTEGVIRYIPNPNLAEITLADVEGWVAAAQ